MEHNRTYQVYLEARGGAADVLDSACSVTEQAHVPFSRAFCSDIQQRHCSQQKLLQFLDSPIHSGTFNTSRNHSSSSAKLRRASRKVRRFLSKKENRKLMLHIQKLLWQKFLVNRRLLVQVIDTVIVQSTPSNDNSRLNLTDTWPCLSQFKAISLSQVFWPLFDSQPFLVCHSSLPRADNTTQGECF